MDPLADRKTVWHEFTPLARECGAVNLGQGFPTSGTPAFVKQALVAATTVGDENQYCRSAGHPELCQELAASYSESLGRAVDWEREIVVCSGATQAIYETLAAHVREGDEVVLLEPFFDIYGPQSRMARGTVVSVPMLMDEERRFSVDMDALGRAFNDKTKIFVLNTPHNPTGKVFTADELGALRDLLLRFPRVIVIADEVYEHIVFDSRKHVSFASLEGMFERTCTISSAGKTFSCTGWKIGWVCGPPSLVRPIQIVQQWVQFSVATPLQAAIASALRTAREPFEGEPSFYAHLRAAYTAKRERMLEALRAAGFPASAPEGSFFILADTRHIDLPAEYAKQLTGNDDEKGDAVTRDWAMARYLTRECGVTMIPPSAFYTVDKAQASNLLRVAFCHADGVIEKAGRRLLRLPPSGGG